MEIGKLIEQRLFDKGRQKILAEAEGKRSLLVQNKIKQEWGREDYISILCREARGGYAWLRLGGWMQRRCKNSAGEGICVFCGEEESWVHILLQCDGTEMWRRKWI